MVIRDKTKYLVNAHSDQCLIKKDKRNNKDKRFFLNIKR